MHDAEHTKHVILIPAPTLFPLTILSHVTIQGHTHPLALKIKKKRLRKHFGVDPKPKRLFDRSNLKFKKLAHFTNLSQNLCHFKNVLTLFFFSL